MNSGRSTWMSSGMSYHKTQIIKPWLEEIETMSFQTIQQIIEETRDFLHQALKPCSKNQSKLKGDGEFEEATSRTSVKD